MAENENSDEIPLIEPEIPEKRNGIVFFDSLRFISMQIVESLNVHGILMILFFKFCCSRFSRLFLLTIMILYLIQSNNPYAILFDVFRMKYISLHTIDFGFEKV